MPGRIAILHRFPIPWRMPVGLLLLLDLATRIYFALRPLEVNDGTLIPDDAYLSLSLARSIASGHGPLYGGEFTNGFQPLYVFLMAPVYLLFPNDLITPVHIALVLLAFFDVAMLYLLLRLCASLSLTLTTGVVVALAWILNPQIVVNTMNGLETGIAGFFMLASLYWFHRSFREGEGMRARPALLLGVLLGASVVARIDNAILAACVGIVILVHGLRKRQPAALVLRSLLFVGLGAALAYAPWALYSLAYTQDLYPISGRAVRFWSLAHVNHAPTWSNWYGPMLKMGLGVVGGRNLGYLVTGAVVFIALLRASRGKGRWVRLPHAGVLAAPLLFAVLLFLAYTLYIFTPWFLARYFFPISVVLLMVLALLLEALFVALAHDTRRKLTAVFVVLLLVVLDAKMLRHIVAPPSTNRGYMKVGQVAQQALPGGTAIGSPQSGALGYFATNLKVFNLDGVVSKSCFEALQERRALEYIRSKRIDYVLGWQSNLQTLANHSTGFRSEDFEVVRIEALKSWGNDWYLARVKY